MLATPPCAGRRGNDRGLSEGGTGLALRVASQRQPPWLGAHARPTALHAPFRPPGALPRPGTRAHPGVPARQLQHDRAVGALHADCGEGGGSKKYGSAFRAAARAYPAPAPCRPRPLHPRISPPTTQPQPAALPCHERGSLTSPAGLQLLQRALAVSGLKVGVKVGAVGPVPVKPDRQVHPDLSRPQLVGVCRGGVAGRGAEVQGQAGARSADARVSRQQRRRRQLRRQRWHSPAPHAASAAAARPRPGGGAHSR